MEDYLSEREQVDRIRQWWKENGAWIIVGLGGGLLALAGWNWWQNYQEERAAQASALYSVVAEAAMEERVDEVRLGVERLASGHAGSPYLQHARMALAAASVRFGDTDAAIAELERVLADAADPQLRLVARLRLARVVLATGDQDRALELARGADGGAFAAALLEVEGDALAARGEDAAARDAYEQAIAAGQGAPGIIDEAFVQLKLEALGQGVPGAADAAADADADVGGETS
ncbi:tetratricopeptide repeat protein [Wenzhouxiangella sp. XN24]|uniref:tetratricopeptide repeat protein n=1 Tax=Wenzhouxiangella sp. XN24 TaxID=2713569 RepID=UPI0013EACA30|nr:tetratricopeptide repeat protein [Wenzhouxiangella sp. XN24]